VDGWGHFSELFGRALFFGVGILILKQYGFSEPFTTLLGLTFTIGPIVTVGPVELGIKILLNRATVRITGKEVFYVEQKNIQAHKVIGHVHGDVIQQPSRESEEKEEDWTIARNFTLEGEGDTKEFQLTMKQGDSLKGHVQAD